MLIGKAQQTECLKVCIGSLSEWDAGIQQLCAKRRSGHSHKTSVSAATPDWCVVLSHLVDIGRLCTMF